MRRGRVVGLSCDAGEVNAVWTIDATGRSRWLARQLGVNVRQRSIPLYARYGYASVDAEHPSLPHLHCDSAGWSWTAKVGPRRAHWLRMSVDGTMPRKTCFPLALQGKVETRTYGADVTWDAAAELTGPGWLLVGDAAGQLDPSSGHGVLRATMGGVMAAQAVVRGATGAYTDWSREWYERDAAQMAANYREAGLRVGRQ